MLEINDLIVNVIIIFSVRPGAPRNVVITTFDAREATLTFIPGFRGHTSISRWIVEAQVGSSVAWTEIFTKTDPEATSLVVTGLIPHTDYTFRLYAENVAGKSDPSDPTNQIQTLQAPPSSFPDDITVRAVNETALIVRWKVSTLICYLENIQIRSIRSR